MNIVQTHSAKTIEVQGHLNGGRKQTNRSITDQRSRPSLPSIIHIRSMSTLEQSKSTRSAALNTSK